MNRLLELQLAAQKDWRLSLRNGLLAGLGGFLGATIVAAILVSFLKPILTYAGLEGYQAAMDRRLDQK